MDYVRFFLLTLYLSGWLLREVTPLGEVVSTASTVNDANSITAKEIKINSELTENNRNTTLVKEHKKDDSNMPKIRKVTLVDSVGIVDKKVNEKPEDIAAAATKNSSTTTAAPVASDVPKLHSVNAYEGGLLNVPVDNAGAANKTIVENKDIKPILLANTTVIPAKSNNASDVKESVNHTNNNSSHVDDSAPAVSKSSSSITKSSDGEISSKIAPAVIETVVSNKNATASTPAAVISPTTKAINITSTPLTTTASTTSASTTTTTTTTTTPKRKKPKITYGVEDFPDLDKESLAIHNLTQHQASSTSLSSGKFPLPEAPYAQPSQEFSNTTFHGGRDYILPIVSMIFIIPLVIGILITTYRRFRDCWSTRHYRRMDFLVDGMYND